VPAPLQHPAGLGLELHDLLVTFAERGGATRAVLDVREFTVTGARQIAVCGPSGSGKTTLLNVLAGLLRPQRGSVHWAAVQVTALSEPALDRWRRETVGLVFQQFHLFPGLSALDNVLLPVHFTQWSVTARQRSRALKLLDRVAVVPGGDPRTLSRGELQRVALARALLPNPPVVLADEPTASLDRTTARSISAMLITLCRETGATLIVATHDTTLADELDEAYDIVECGLKQRPMRRSVDRLAVTA